jgi:glycerol uptake facilitator-like aquaporin
MSASLSRQVAAEALGTAFLLAVVVGSGIMAEHLLAVMWGWPCLPMRWQPAAG